MESIEIEPFAPDFENNETINIDDIINKYESHPVFLKIKENVEGENKCLFNDNITTNYFKNELYKLDPKKASTENDIPTKILIKSGDIVYGHLINIYNNSKIENKYPQSLKVADVTPIHKKRRKDLNEKLSSSESNPNCLQIIREKHAQSVSRIH